MEPIFVSFRGMKCGIEAFSVLKLSFYQRHQINGLLNPLCKECTCIGRLSPYHLQNTFVLGVTQFGSYV